MSQAIVYAYMCMYMTVVFHREMDPHGSQELRSSFAYLTGLLVKRTFKDLSNSSLSSPCNSGFFNFVRNMLGLSELTSV